MSSSGSSGAMDFVLSEGQGIDAVLDELATRFQIDAPRAAILQLVFYDSFDWRIYRQGMMLCHELAGDQALLCCYTLERRLVDAIASARVPRFVHELPAATLRARLEKVVDIRALLEVARLKCRRRAFVLRNEDAKIVARLRHEHLTAYDGNRGRGEALPGHLSLAPLRGFTAEADAVCRILERGGLRPPTRSLLEDALRCRGRQAGDYSSKLNIAVDGDAQASVAMATILTALLDAMRVNEPGMRGDWDSEFLHDFRVAVRRTRSALSQVRGVFDADRLARFKEDFSWLGTVTGPKRDLDVHVLDFDQHCTAVPPGSRKDLAPLLDYLKTRRAEAARALIEALDSDRYRKLLRDWARFLAGAAAGKWARPRGTQTIHRVADRRIWRAYRKVLREGRAITRESPDEDLHELRKTCKKLRYLIEFFNSMYPHGRARKVIAKLRRLQENLGTFQDQSIQADSLRDFAGALASAGAPADTLLAMGAMIEQLRRDHERTRAAFADRFAAFDQPANRKLFAELFKPVSRAVERQIGHDPSKVGAEN